MTTKYLELVGSVEFNSYMQSVLNKKLGLQNDSRFQAFLVDLLVNSVDFSTQSKARALALEKFVILTLQLDNPAFYQQFPDVKKMFMRELEANFGSSSSENLGALLEDADFMLAFSVVSLAKNQNFFGQIDTYMKEFARLTLQFPDISNRLEAVLSKEIAIVPSGSYFVADAIKQQPINYLPHHNVMAHARFQFLPLAMKTEELQKNVSL